MIGNEGGMEYHEEPIEYHDQECYFFLLIETEIRNQLKQ